MDKEGFLASSQDTGGAGEYGRAAHFSTMDFKIGFWQVRMTLELQQYTRFTVGNLGFYEFTRKPFGLCNAPVTFQHLMQNTLGELNLTYCIIYLEDVIICGHTEEHLEHLWVVLECFREFNLKLNPSKCSFFQTEIVYLTHHVSKEGICPSEENVCTILESPMPETYTEVRAFVDCLVITTASSKTLHIWHMHCMT